LYRQQIVHVTASLWIGRLRAIPVWNRDAIAAKSDTFPRFMKKLILFL